MRGYVDWPYAPSLEPVTLALYVTPHHMSKMQVKDVRASARGNLGVFSCGKTVE